MTTRRRRKKTRTDRGNSSSGSDRPPSGGRSRLGGTTSARARKKSRAVSRSSACALRKNAYIRCSCRREVHTASSRSFRARSRTPSMRLHASDRRGWNSLQAAPRKALREVARKGGTSSPAHDRSARVFLDAWDEEGNRVLAKHIGSIARVMKRIFLLTVLRLMLRFRATSHSRRSGEWNFETAEANTGRTLRVAFRDPRQLSSRCSPVAQRSPGVRRFDARTLLCAGVVACGPRRFTHWVIDDPSTKIDPLTRST